MDKYLNLIGVILFSVMLSAFGKPNFIVIVCDDLGLGDIPGFGYEAPAAETPHLSKMAEEGVKLTRFMVTMPYCAPSRASFLTGRYPFHHGIVGNPTPDQGINDYGLPPSEITIAEILKPVGYDCYAVGKWHLGHKPRFLPTRQGFDEYFGILYSNDMRPVQIVENEKVVEYPVDQTQLTRKYTSKTIEFMRRSVETSRPFLLFLNHPMPHKPLAASDWFYTPETPGDLYQDVIRELDWSVGEILDAIKTMGIETNTLVIFTSDNGPWYGGSTGGLRGMKDRSWDGGLRVPFIARWPGHISEGMVNTSPVSSIDLLPTLAKLAGAECPEDREIDGENIWSVLTDPSAKSPHPYLIGMRRKEVKVVYGGKWKLHINPYEQYREPTKEQLNREDPRAPDGITIIAPTEQPGRDVYPGLKTGDVARHIMLFDIEADPGEQHNLAEEYPEVVKRLKSYYDQTVESLPDLKIPKGSAFRKIEGGRLDFWNEQ